MSFHRLPTTRPGLLAGVLIGGVLGLAVLLTGASLTGAGTPRAAPRFEPESTESAPIRVRQPTIRVRIHRNTDSVRIQGVSGPHLVIHPPAGGDAELVTGPLVVEPTRSTISVTDAAGTRRTYTPRALANGSTTGLQITPVASVTGDENRRVRINGVDHPGLVRVHLRDSGGRRSRRGLDVIAIMPVEQYIPGVIAKELYSDWPRATFQAQAVAARSYALHQREWARSLGRTYDIESTTRDQAFEGATTLKTAVGACESTRGIVLTDEGELLRCYYSSTCGGARASAEHTFSVRSGYGFNRAGPLQVSSAGEPDCPCNGAPRHRWTRTHPANSYAQRLRAFGEKHRMNVGKLGSITELGIEHASDSGRPTVYFVDDDMGKRYLMPAETMRVASNFSTRGVGKITSKTRVLSSHFGVELVGAEVRFTGQGFGHGVGLCQWGAKGLAVQGQNWREILERYYPGATISRAY